MLESKLIENVQDNELNCPKCQSVNIKKAGNRGNKKQYRCAVCGRWFVEKVINVGVRIDSRHILPKGITPNEMRHCDVWDLRILGKKPSLSGDYTLNFADIYTDWLKSTVKDYIWARVAIHKASTLNNKLGHLKHFSEYINKESIVKVQDIDRQVILGFFNYLSSKKLAGRTRNGIIGTLNEFIEYCQNYKPLEITEARLIFPEDYPKREKSQVKDVPPYVLKQLDNNIHHLARPIALQVKILRETGMRISEVVGLSINCIQPDNDGDWWIYPYREKMEKESRLLITKELAQEIIEQQKFIREEVSADFTYLFCTTEGSSWFDGYRNPNNKTIRKELNHFVPIPKQINQKVVRGYLYYLANEHNITDVSGSIYPVWRCHQFRHTHLSDCARKGMGIAHIMQRAGHLTPAMSIEYIHLTDEDQKKKMKEVWDNTHFNIEGEIVASPNPDLDTADLQWIKKGMNVQTSDNGYCTLLVTQNCIHQNLSCKECGSWATTLDFLDAHKKDLSETEKIIENARVKGWQRQVEKNVPRAERLKKIVNGMEKHKNMKGLGHNEWEKEGDDGSK